MEVQDLTNGSMDHEWYLCNLARKELTDEWFLTRSIRPSMFLVAAYLLFVTLIGPRLMKNRKAFKLKPIVLVFNLAQCLINTFIWTTDSFLIWLYYVTKLTDLLDTVLFVLKKKQSQVTFLHTYHHAVMVPGTLYFGLHLGGTQIIIVGGINSFVHTIMYTYYFLSAFGPSMQKYLWWKIYVTRLQMLQFMFIIAYMGFIIVNQCSVPEAISYGMIVGTLTITILFLNFYIRAYIQRKETPGNTSEKSTVRSNRKSPNKKES